MKWHYEVDSIDLPISLEEGEMFCDQTTSDPQPSHGWRLDVKDLALATHERESIGTATAIYISNEKHPKKLRFRFGVLKACHKCISWRIIIWPRSYDSEQVQILEYIIN